MVLNGWGRLAASVLWALLLKRRLIGTSCFYAYGRQRANNLFVLRLSTKLTIQLLKLYQQSLDNFFKPLESYKVMCIHIKCIINTVSILVVMYLGVKLCMYTARKVLICVLLPKSIILNKAKVRAVKETITQGCSVIC